jgi:Tfp pilus assembly protein PilF
MHQTPLEQKNWKVTQTGKKLLLPFELKSWLESWLAVIRCVINSSSKETETQKEAKKHKEQGNKHFSKGEFAEAEHWFTQAIECTVNDSTSVDDRKQRAVYYNNRAASR